MMTYDEIQACFGLAASEYAAACRKHPVFPTEASAEKALVLEEVLSEVRHLNRRDDLPTCTIRSVQSEELLEAVIEAKRGRWAKAKQETLHLIATAMRAYEHYSEMERKEKSND